MDRRRGGIRWLRAQGGGGEGMESEEVRGGRDVGVGWEVSYDLQFPPGGSIAG